MNGSVNQIDDIDRRLLEMLSDNARIPIVELSKQIGLSRVAIKTRISSLEKAGVIEKYTLVLNPERIGNAITVSLDLTISPEHLEEVCEILKKSPYIHKLYQMTGNSSLHSHAMLPDNKALEEFMQKTIYRLPGLQKVECNTVLARIKDDSEIRI